jgi:hypothetical protein
MKPYRPFFLILTVLMLLLNACGSPEAPAPTPDVNELVNKIAATIQMGYTQTALAMPTATITNTPEPTLTLAASSTSPPLVIATPTTAIPPTATGPTPLPVNPATANGCYNASLVSEGTVPNRTDFKPGDTFTKTWRLVNTGTCDWNGEFKIMHVSGDNFGSDTTKIRQRVGVGIIADVSLEMTAPSGVSGTVVSNWQMVSDTGLAFGPVLTVSILLPGSNATATSVGCYGATLVSSSLPKGYKAEPGEEIEQAWQIKNSGTCDWTGDFKITHVGGYDFENADTTRIRQGVPAGSNAQISLFLIAPSDAGTYKSSWQMATADGDLFGQVFTIEIEVKE